MIEIDGSMGEGGGQVLRSALSLSILTRQPFLIYNIRLGRKKPGLKAQHLKAVDAAAAISRAAVEGAQLDSTRLTFTPGELRTGRYKFDIGTAGSTSLVLQTVFMPLSLGWLCLHGDDHRRHARPLGALLPLPGMAVAAGDALPRL